MAERTRTRLSGNLLREADCRRQLRAGDSMRQSQILLTKRSGKRHIGNIPHEGSASSTYWAFLRFGRLRSKRNAPRVLARHVNSARAIPRTWRRGRTAHHHAVEDHLHLCQGSFRSGTEFPGLEDLGVSPSFVSCSARLQAGFARITVCRPEGRRYKALTHEFPTHVLKTTATCPHWWNAER